MPTARSDAVPAVRALIVTGTVGVGKTTTAVAVGDLLGERGTPHAVIDLDWLRRAWPLPPDDPFGSAVELRNLAAVAAVYLDHGAQRLVLAGVVGDGSDASAHRRALGDRVHDLAVCRLTLDAAVAHQRLARRHDLDDAVRDWHQNRFAELDAALDRSAVADVTVTVDARTPRQVAADVLRAVDW